MADTMRQRPSALALSLLSAGLIALYGCGGSNSPTSTAAAGPSEFRVVIQWPDESDGRLLPSAAASVRVDLSSAAGVNLSQTAARPPDPATESVLTFNQQFTVGDTLTLVATAFPNADATGTAQARGTQVVAVPAQTTPLDVRITMASTVNSFALSPDFDSLEVGEQVPITATALDSQGAMVLLKPGLFAWSLGTANNRQASNQYATLLGDGSQSQLNSTNVLRADAMTPANTRVIVTCSVLQQFGVPASGLTATGEFLIEAIQSPLAGTAVDLGNFGGDRTIPVVVLPDGTVVGNAIDAQFNGHGFIIVAGGTIQDLGTSGNVPEPITDVNVNLVGCGNTTNGGFLFDASDGATAFEQRTTLTGPNGEEFTANAINDGVQVAGSFQTTNGGPFAAVVDADGNATNLHPLVTSSPTATSELTVINNNNIVGGQVTDVPGGTFDPQPFLINLDTHQVTFLPRGTFGGEVNDLNDQNVVVGFTFNSNGFAQATRWDAQGNRQVFGSLGGNNPFVATDFTAISPNGQIIVGGGVDSLNGIHGIVVNTGEGNDVIELTDRFTPPQGTPFVRFYEAADVNGSNQIVSAGILNSNNPSFPDLGAFLLNPN